MAGYCTLIAWQYYPRVNRSFVAIVDVCFSLFCFHAISSSFSLSMFSVLVDRQHILCLQECTCCGSFCLFLLSVGIRHSVVLSLTRPFSEKHIIQPSSFCTVLSLLFYVLSTFSAFMAVLLCLLASSLAFLFCLIFVLFAGTSAGLLFHTQVLFVLFERNSLFRCIFFLVSCWVDLSPLPVQEEALGNVEGFHVVRLQVVFCIQCCTRASSVFVLMLMSCVLCLLLSFSVIFSQ